MSIRNLLLILPILLCPFAIGITGCGESGPTVIETEEMTEQQEEQYEEESYGSADDEDQN